MANGYWLLAFMLVILSFILGAAVGSFVNVLAARIVAEKSILWPRSFCDKCAKPLWPRDMIPIVSFFLLKARCRFCHIKIAWQYPVVEFVTAMLFLVAARGHSGAELIFYFIAIAALIALFLTDLRAMILPDQISITAIVILTVLNIFVLHTSLISLIVAVVIGGGFFLAQYILSHGAWVGSGDIRFGILMGVILAHPVGVLLALAISYILGAFISLPLLIFRKKGLKSEIPLGTFLVIGTIFVLLFL